jgi:AraC-like DNA-binding protein
MAISPEIQRINAEHINASRVEQPVPPRLKPRGIPPALHPHEVYATDSVPLAAELGRPVFGEHRIEAAAAPAHPFLASMHAVRLRDLTLAYVDFVAAVDIHADRMPDHYSVFMAMNGESHTLNRGAVAVATPVAGAIPHPGSPAEMHWHELSPHLVVTIRHDALHLHLARLLGRSLDKEIDFELELDMSQATANRWSSAIQLFNTELFHEDSLLHMGIGMGPLEEFVMSALLFGHSSNYSADLTHPNPTAGRRVVRAAVDYIERHLAEDLTLGKIAESAGCSVRSLQDGFRVEFNTTPWAYVRDRRLVRARSQLLDAGPGTATTVAEVAFRWGFGHLGRFAAAYRTRFGETPSQTLRS